MLNLKSHTMLHFEDKNPLDTMQNPFYKLPDSIDNILLKIFVSTFVRVTAL